MLPKFRSFVRPIIRLFVRSFIVPIHRSSFVHSSYSSVIVRSSSLFIVHRSFIQLFTITIQRYYSHTLFIIVTIYHYYSSSLLFIDDIYNYFSVATIHRHYLSIIWSPQISTTHPSCCPVHLRPARPMFQSYELRWLWFSFQWKLPIWSPIPGFSKLSMLNFEIPSNQGSKLRFQ
jgi:hypothetical protein